MRRLLLLLALLLPITSQAQDSTAADTARLEFIRLVPGDSVTTFMFALDTAALRVLGLRFAELQGLRELNQIFIRKISNDSLQLFILEGFVARRDTIIADKEGLLTDAMSLLDHAEPKRSFSQELTMRLSWAAIGAAIFCALVCNLSL